MNRFNSALPDDVAEAAQVIVQQHPSVLTSPRMVARVLCGISSPILISAKLTREPVFGKFTGHSFGKIIQEIESADVFG